MSLGPRVGPYSLCLWLSVTLYVPLKPKEGALFIPRLLLGLDQGLEFRTLIFALSTESTYQTLHVNTLKAPNPKPGHTRIAEALDLVF